MLIHLTGGLEYLNVIRLGHFDHQFDHKITPFLGLGIKGPLPFEPKGLSGLAFLRDLNVDSTFYGRNSNRRTGHGLTDSHRHVH